MFVVLVTVKQSWFWFLLFNGYIFLCVG